MHRCPDASRIERTRDVFVDASARPSSLQRRTRCEMCCLRCLCTPADCKKTKACLLSRWFMGIAGDDGGEGFYSCRRVAAAASKRRTQRREAATANLRKLFSTHTQMNASSLSLPYPPPPSSPSTATTSLAISASMRCHRENRKLDRSVTPSLFPRPINHSQPFAQAVGSDPPILRDSSTEAKVWICQICESQLPRLSAGHSFYLRFAA